MPTEDWTELRRIEWEYLAAQIQIENLSESLLIIPRPDLITVKRNEEYGVDVLMEGENASTSLPMPQNDIRPGEFLSGADIHGNPVGDYTGTKISLANLYQGSRSIRGDGKFSMGGMLDTVSCEYPNEGPIHKVIEYCVSGPKIRIFPRTTEKDFEATSKVDRPLSESAVPDFWSYKVPVKTGQSNRDSIYLSNKHFEVLCAKVQNGFVPKWLCATGVHFGPQKESQDPEYRAKVLEALSFAFGRRLVSVGHSFFNSGHYPLLQFARHPYSHNLKAECAHQSYVPTHLEANYSQNIETTTAIAAGLYLDNREKYSLNDVLWNTWIARGFPWGMNLVAYSGALESLAKTWLTANPDRGVYIPKDEFNNKLSVIFSEIEKTLPNTDNWKIILNKLKGVNSIGSADRLKKFIQALGLPIGDVEKNIFAARNRFAHGGNFASTHTVFLSNATKAYETLINRVLLGVLGYKGKYVDYSTYGFPMRELSQPLGGPEGDGKLNLPK